MKNEFRRKSQWILLFLLLTNMQLSYGQQKQTSITLSVKNIKLEHLITELEKQSKYLFIVNQEVNIDQKISITLDKISFTTALNKIFTPIHVSYKIEGNHVLLFKKSSSANVPRKEITVKGQVLDEYNQPIIGANIKEKAQKNGCITDVDGFFELKTSVDAVAIISYIGFTPKEFVCKKSDAGIIILQEDSKMLDDLVVIGYGMMKKSSLTGAVSSIKKDEIATAAVTSIDQALGGRIAGLISTQRSGQPGAGMNVQIRGAASFASSGVLYVVDGVPINGGASEPGTNNSFGKGVDRSGLNFLNPEDIESMEVLKDASSAAIYGARAGAGVVLITTKRGKTGAAKVSYSGSYAFQQPAEFYEMLNQKDYMIERNRVMKEKWLLTNNAGPYGNGNDAGFVPKFSEEEIAMTGAGKNALKEITRPGYMHQHNISIAGGTDKTKYFISGNYLNQIGVIKASGFERFSGRANLDQEIFKNVKMGLNITVFKSFSDNSSLGGEGSENAGIIQAAFYHPPTVPLIDENGNYPLNPEYTKAANPLSFLTITDKTASSRLLTSAFVEWEIISNLKAKGNFSYDQSNAKRSNYLPKTFLYGERVGGDATITETSSNIALIEYTLAYAKNFGHHNVNGVIGYSYQAREMEGFAAGNKQFVSDGFLYNNLNVGEYDKPFVSSSKGTQIWASYFARVGYDYKGKYLFQASFRRDGSSNFAENKKYGTFPSISIGWKVSEEKFLQKAKAISFLKLRASYGTTGNSNIGGGAYAAYKAGSSGGLSSNYIFGESQFTGVYMSQIDNPNLTWETAKEFNLGLDYGFFNNRISGSIEAYNKIISNLLSSKELYTSSPVKYMAANIGKTRSRGVELTIKSVNIDTRNFSWKTDFNISHYQDTWLERDPMVLKTMGKYIGAKDPIRAIYGYQTDGIMQAGEKAPKHMPDLKPGMVKVKDVNGYDEYGELTWAPDGKLNSADMSYLGTTDPDVTLGFGNTFKYKNFDLNIFMYAMIGRLKYNSDKAAAYNLSETMGAYGWNALNMVKDRWASDNQSGVNPSGMTTPYGDFSGDFYRENGNFLKCRNITLGYSLSEEVATKTRIFKSLRVYVDGQNLFTFTKYSGIDPELDSFLTYPAQRSFVLGITATF